MKKIGLLVLALIMALGALGVGYAAWTSAVSVNATVATGNVLVGIKDLGDSTSTPTNGAPVGTPAGYFDGLTYSTPNSYPGRIITYNTEGKNLGTLPVALSVLGSSSGDFATIFAGATVRVGINGGPLSSPIPFTTIASMTAALNSALIALGPLPSTATLGVKVVITLDPALDPAAQNKTTTFGLTITGTQAP